VRKKLDLANTAKVWRLDGEDLVSVRMIAGHAGYPYDFRAAFSVPGPEWIQGTVLCLFFLFGCLVDIGSQPIFEEIFCRATPAAGAKPGGLLDRDAVIGVGHGQDGLVAIFSACLWGRESGRGKLGLGT